MAWENEEDVPRPQGNPAEEGLPSPAVSGLPKLILNFSYILTDGTGVYSRSCVTGEEAGRCESRFIY